MWKNKIRIIVAALLSEAVPTRGWQHLQNMERKKVKVQQSRILRYQAILQRWKQHEDFSLL